MTYADAEQFLTSFNNLPRHEYTEMTRLSPAADRRRLEMYQERLKFFLRLIGHPEKKIPHYIHVAGTSGKGSVATFLSAMVTAAGKTTGLMISPAPSRVTEHWRLNGQPMPEKDFTACIAALKPKLDAYARTSPFEPLSWFDLVTAIGFWWFAKKQVDWGVIEVGLGGRYDSTNVLPRKDIAVITTIGLDHTELLGNTKTKIAYEKAGIITPGCRVFTMERDKKVLDVIKRECKKKSAKLSCIMYHVTRNNTAIRGTDFQYDNKQYHITAIGQHQIRNAALCIDIARHLGIPHSAIREGLQKAKQPLRIEVVSKNPLIILDGAHNPDKMKTTVEAMQTIMNNNGTMGQWNNIHLIVGFSGDKNVKRMIRQLSTLQPSTIACTRNTTNPFRKVADPKLIAKQFKILLPKTKVEIFLDPNSALEWSIGKVKNNDILLATGSIFLSGELRATLTNRV